MVVLSTSISPSQMRLYLVCTVHLGPELIKSSKIFQRKKKVDSVFVRFSQKSYWQV